MTFISFRYGVFVILALAFAVVSAQTFVSGGGAKQEAAQGIPAPETPRFLFAEGAEPFLDIPKIVQSRVAAALNATTAPNVPRVARLPAVHGSALLADSAAQTSGLLSGLHRSAASALPDIRAEAWLVGDALSGNVYVSNNADKRWPLASITKLMSAVVVQQKGETEAVVTIPPSFTSETGDTNAAHLTGGSRYRADDLLKLMLVTSSNEAAEALAGHHGFLNFVSEMNATARDWELADTYFDEPTGLSISDMSTPRDTFRLVSKIYETHPTILQITRKTGVTIADVDTRVGRSFPSTNSFAGKQEFLGGKTGFTDDARGNLVSVFDYGRPVVIVVFGTEDRFGETEKIFTWFKTNFKTSPSAT